MAEPFIFHFKPNFEGEPETMYVADLLAECALCKYEQIQRFFHSTSLHRLTLEILENLTSQVASKIDLECENCGTPFSEEDVLAATLTFGFADDSGCIIAFLRDKNRVFQVQKGKRLDPQALPGFELPKHSVDPEYFEEKLGRVINPKKLWLELFDPFFDETEKTFDGEKKSEGWSATASPHYHFLVHRHEDTHLELLEDMSRENDFNIALDNLPSELPLHNEEFLFAPYNAWLPTHVLADLENESLFATAIVPRMPIIEAITRAFSVAGLEYEMNDKEFRNIRTPTEVVFDSPISILAVAERSVYTGLTPGEAARLTAEEVVGTLLGVWR